MMLNVELLMGAHRVTTIAVSRSLEILCLDDPVDATTGLPVEVSPWGLDGLSVWEVARALLERYAGDTAFVIRCGAGFAIVRPAFSELPVYYWRRGNRVDVWSGLSVPAFVRRDPPPFDLAYLSASLLNMSWATPATGLQGIAELLSGAVLLFDGRSIKQMDVLAATVAALAPHEATRSYDDDVSAARELIGNALQHKIARHRDRFSVLCSGGVDSAVLAVAAARLNPGRPLPLINSYSAEDRDGDERFYFRQVADHIGATCALVETNSQSSRTDLSSHLLAATVRPTKTATTIPTTSLLYGAAAGQGSRCVLTGDGGDQLFLLNAPVLYSREIAAESVSRAAALRALAGVAIRSRSTLWQIAGEVLHGRQSRRLKEHFFGRLRFKASPLVPGSIPAGGEVVPNAAKLAHLGAGRAFQFFGMRNAELNRVVLKDCAVEERKPFLFWPLVRFALRARRLHHIAGGRDRALERDAFRAELPAAIYHRVGKGAGRDLLARYDFPVMAQGLLDSPVSRRNVICKEQIENVCTKDIDDETALVLVRARGIADWMEFYE